MKIPRKGLALLLLGSGLFAQGTRPSRSPAGAFRIAGTVVNANTSQPVPGAQVDVENTRNEKDTYSVVADDDGRFQFQVGLGKYSLRGAKRGFLTFAYEQHENFWTGIATGGGFDTEHLVLRLPPAAAITGKVTDDNGEPVRGATVTVYREDHRNGATEIHAVEGTTTDDLGSYEVTPIDAGTYFVMAMAEPWYAIHPSSGASTRLLLIALSTWRFRIRITETQRNPTTLPQSRCVRETARRRTST